MRCTSGCRDCIKRRWGDLRPETECISIQLFFGEALDSKIWSKDKRNEIIIIREQSSIKSFWHCTNEKGEERTLTDQDMFDVTCYRLPLPIDPVNSERGLWKMVDWSKWDVILDCGLMEIYETKLSGSIIFTTGMTDPETALLKALINQEGL